ncbi:MAG: right-handed parallel beta-helix repeat-containing protein [Deltaproteobacteria bacterium]|nr:right-handed parallel beta-helix repeat-containing protein [Deltaproteobacteria bacterium]
MSRGPMKAPWVSACGLLAALLIGCSSDSASEPPACGAGACADGGADALSDGSSGGDAKDGVAPDSAVDAKDSGVVVKYGAELFVALDGNDGNPGTKAQPFATLERARKAVRDMKAGPGLPADGVVVWLRGGRFLRSETFALRAEDSGEPGKPVVYRGYPGEQARLVGGKLVEPGWFTQVDSTSPVWSRLDPSAQGKLMQVDLPAHGITDLGELKTRGFAPNQLAALELFFNQAPMTLARWPDVDVTEGVPTPQDDTVTLYGNPGPDVTGVYAKSGTSDNVNSYQRQGLVGGKQFNLYRYNWDYNGSNHTAWFVTTTASGYPNDNDPWWYRYADGFGTMEGSNGATGEINMNNPVAINHGFASIAAAPSDTTFQYAGTRPERWGQASEVWLHGYWKYMWADLHVKAASIDVGTKTISLAEVPGYGIAAAQPWYAENLVEEITTAGEWMVERPSGMLYFWPPADLAAGETIVSTLTTPLVEIKDASYVIVQDLVLEAGRGDLLSIEGGDHDSVVGCVLRNAGNAGAAVSGSTNGLERCEVVDTGDEGVRLSGGDRASLLKAQNFVRNSHLHRFGRWSWTYNPGVLMSGAGHVVAHNVFDTAPHTAILYTGNEHLIEYNVIHDVCRYSSDAGAIYTGRDWGYRGNQIRYNFIHDIQTWFDGYGVNGVYLDDCVSGNHVFGNVLYKITGQAILNGGGRDNILENNILARNGNGLYGDSRGLQYIDNTPGSSWNLLERLTYDGIQYQQAPWSTAYPKLAAIPNDWAQVSDPNQQWRYPQGCVFSRNAGFANTNFTVESDYGGTGTFDKYESMVDNLADQDPMFVDEAALNLNLKPGSPVLAIPGFQPIPFDQIGIEP